MLALLRAESSAPVLGTVEVLTPRRTARTVRPEALTVPPLPLPSVSPGLTTHPLTPSHFLGPPASYPDASGNTYKGLDMDCATHRAMKVNDTGALRALQAQELSLVPCADLGG